MESHALVDRPTIFITCINSCSHNLAGNKEADERKETEFNGKQSSILTITETRGNYEAAYICSRKAFGSLNIRINMLTDTMQIFLY